MSRTTWSKIVKQFPEANFLQSPEYGKMNETLGCKVVTDDFDGKGWVLMIVRDAKRGRYLEIPCGPLIDWSNPELVQVAMKRIKEVAQNEKCVFVRMRPQLRAKAENSAILEKTGLRISPMHLAAEHTVMVDLNATEEEMLARMRRQTRYEVRRADKLDITVDKGRSEELFREFHTVQVETAKRQNFVPPDAKTLMAEREAFGDRIWIYVAKTGTEKADKAPSDIPQGQPIAYGLIIGDGREAAYYEAASTDLNRKLPGAYALLWQAMRDLKVAGYERFNLWGIAPAGQPGHRYAGVTTFKMGFGGEVVEYVPAHDMVISPLKYLKNYIVETARKKKRHL